MPEQVNVTDTKGHSRVIVYDFRGGHAVPDILDETEHLRVFLRPFRGELVLGGYLTPMQMAEKMSYNPAKIIGIDKGDIEPGKVADIVIFDPDETYVIDKNTFFSKGRNTPFDGRKVTGKVRMTLVNGQVVYEDKEK